MIRPVCLRLSKSVSVVSIAIALVVLPGSASGSGQIDVAESRCVPAPGTEPGDISVVNITTTGAAEQGFGTLRSSDAVSVLARDPEERFSSVNFAGGAPNPNLAVVLVGADGKVCYDAAGTPHDAILDQLSVIEGAAALTDRPRRLADTRTGTPLAAGSSLCVDVDDSFNAGDLLWINVTPISASGVGFGSLRPSERSPDEIDISSVNFDRAQSPNPNLAPVQLGASRSLCYDASVAEHHVAIDFIGGIRSEHVRSIDAARILDTRQQRGPVESDATVCVALDSDAVEPGDLVAVNITPVRASGGGYGVLRSSQSTPTQELAADDRYSSVNIAPGRSADPNLTVVEVDAERLICYDAAVATHDVVLDLVAVISARAVKSVSPSRLLDTRPTSPACTPPFDSASASMTTTSLRQLSDNEFQRLVDLTSSAGVQYGPPPSITGDRLADARIRTIAENRGYRQRIDVGAAGLVWVGGRLLEPATAEAYGALVRSAHSAGLSIQLSSAYRSVARQRSIFVGKLRSAGISNSDIRSHRADQGIDSILRFSSIPGFSRHHTGVVVDLASGGSGINAFGGTAAYRWISANNFAEAKRHGFVPSYPATAGAQGPNPEPWEFVFVGRESLLETDRFGRIEALSLNGARLTVTGTFTDPSQAFTVHVDDQEGIVAIARCILAGPQGEFVLKVSLDPARQAATDLCVVSEIGSSRRLLRCSP